MMRLLGLLSFFGTVVHAGGSIVDCGSVTVCRIPPPFEDYDTPAVSFYTNSGGTIDISADLWLTPDCPNDPDASAFFPSQDIPSDGQWFMANTDWLFPDGTEFSIQWTIGDCSITDCTNGTTGKSPDICNLD